MAEKLFCPRCSKEKAPINFFKLRDNKGYFEMCKECTCAHIDNFNTDTFMWILEKADVPWVEAEWIKIRDKVIREKGWENLKTTSVVGKYLSLMKINTYAKYRYADSEKFANEIASKRQAAIENINARKEILDKDLAEGKISQQEYDLLTAAPDVEELKPEFEAPTEEMLAEIAAKSKNGPGVSSIGPVTSLNFFDENNYIPEEELPDPAANMSQELKIELAMKWGRLYSPQELLALEQYYNEMMSSFDIHDADTLNTLRLLSKTVLKMDQAMDRGDTDTYLKLSKVADMQRKSAKFTAAQNKADNINTFDSVGAVVALCEKQEGFIPRFVPDEQYPQDKIDLTLKDTQNYLYNLVTEDLGFSQQLENAIKNLQNRQAAEALAEKETELDNYYNADRHILDDESFEDFYASVEEQRAADAGIVAALDLSHSEV